MTALLKLQSNLMRAALVILKANPYHDEKGRFTGADHRMPVDFMAGRSKKYGPYSGIERYADLYHSGVQVTYRHVSWSKMLATQGDVSAQGMYRHGEDEAEFPNAPGPKGLRNSKTGIVHLVDGHHRSAKAHRAGKSGIGVYTIDE